MRVPACPAFVPARLSARRPPTTRSATSSPAPPPPSPAGWFSPGPALFGADPPDALRALCASARPSPSSPPLPPLLRTSPLPSPVERRVVRGRAVYVKRDDLLRLPGSAGGISGNKARKMYGLGALSAEDFPECVVSHGGPQSNAMVSLAAAVAARNSDSCGGGDRGSREKDDAFDGEGRSRSLRGRFRFLYYTKRLPRYLRNQPSGNLLRATALGTELLQMSPDEYSETFSGPAGTSGGAPPPGLPCPGPGRALWIPQGAACAAAWPGAVRLAVEVAAFWEGPGGAGGEKEEGLAVVVPSGTGATALLLHRALHAAAVREAAGLGPHGGAGGVAVVAVPCVGDARYLRRQMAALDVAAGTGDGTDLPEVLEPVDRRDGRGALRPGYFSFGEPHRALLKTWQELGDEHGLFVDLLYGAPAWNIMFGHWRNALRDGENRRPLSPIDGKTVMYLHTGGLEGLSSQLTRYKHKGYLESDKVQK